MLSRVADSLFWMSRYMERTDCILRILKTNYALSQESQERFSWRPVLQIFSHPAEDAIDALEKDTRAVLILMIAGKDNSNSVCNMVTRSRENARSVQDNITIELWQCLNEFYHMVRDERLNRMLKKDDPVATLDMLIRQSMVYFGISESTMFRGEGFSFMSIGRYLERAIQSIDILDIKFSDLSYDMEKPADITYWKHLLLSISGYNLYLKTYRSAFEARNVLDQVIFNANFPRSVIYSLNQLQRYFERLRSHVDPQGYKEMNFMVGRIRSKIQYSNLEQVSQVGLHQYLIGVKEDLNEIGNALNRHYFAYS